MTSTENDTQQLTAVEAASDREAVITAQFVLGDAPIARWSDGQLVEPRRLEVEYRRTGSPDSTLRGYGWRVTALRLRGYRVDEAGTRIAGVRAYDGGETPILTGFDVSPHQLTARPDLMWMAQVADANLLAVTA